MTKTCDVCGGSAPFMNLCITCSLWHSFQEIRIRGSSFETKRKGLAPTARSNRRDPLSRARTETGDVDRESAEPAGAEVGSGRSRI